MVTLSNHADQVEACQKPARRHICSRLLVLVGLGAMVLAVFGLLPGCGSDSTPAGVVKGKNAPTATKSGTMKPQAVARLLSDQEETGPGKKALVKKQPDPEPIEVFPGVTQEEVEAKIAASQTNPPKEVFPGLTQVELDAKVQAAGQKPDLKLMMENFPGAPQGKRN